MKNSEENKTDQEDNDEMELEGLDLQSIATTCARKEVHSIPENQIQLLKSTFLKSKHKDKAGSTQKGKHSTTSSLGIKNHSSKEITKETKEDKKRGRPSNKQLLQELGELLVNWEELEVWRKSSRPNLPILNESYHLEYKRPQWPK
jgi:hypothetical protein